MENILMIKNRRRLHVNLPIYAKQGGVPGEELQFDGKWLGAEEGGAVDVISDFAGEGEEGGHAIVWMMDFGRIYVLVCVGRGEVFVIQLK